MSYDIEDQAGQGSLSPYTFAIVAVLQRARDEKGQRRRGESASETPRCLSECSQGADLLCLIRSRWSDRESGRVQRKQA